MSCYNINFFNFQLFFVAGALFKNQLMQILGFSCNFKTSIKMCLAHRIDSVGPPIVVYFDQVVS